MVPEAFPHDADPISQIRFPETPAYLHDHAKRNVLGPHEPSLEANTVWWRISERQGAIFFALLEVIVAPGVEVLVALVPVR
jgi:hypothetical protein